MAEWKDAGIAAGRLGEKVIDTLFKDRKKPKPRTTDEKPGLSPLPEPPAAGVFVDPAPHGFGALMPPGTAPMVRLVPVADRESAVEGTPVEGISGDTRPPAQPVRPVARPASASWLAGRTSDGRLDAVRKVASDANTTMSQKVAAEEAGRQAIKGDKLALKLALANLVEKLDFTSPQNSAVLLAGAAGDQASMQAMMLMARGKMTLEGTQGGQLFRQLAPVLQKVSPIDVKKEVDEAWGGMAEKFASQAKGSVDVVLKADPAAADALPPGARLGVSASPSPGGRAKLGITEVPDSASDVESVMPGEKAAARKVKLREISEPAPGAETIDIGSPESKSKLRISEVVRPASASGTDPAEEISIDSRDRLKMREVEHPSADADEREDVSIKGGRRLPVKEMGAEASDVAEVELEKKRGSMPSGGRLVEVLDSLKSNSKIAGKLGIRELLDANPHITQLNLHQMTPSSGGAPTVQSLGSMTRDALLRKFGF